MNRTGVGEQGQYAEEQGRRVRRAERGEEAEGEPIERLREVGRNLGAQIEEQARKRPYVVIGAAAGIGFVAGSLFGSRLGQLLLAAGIGYAVKNLVDEGDLGVERLQERLEQITGERQQS